MIKFMKSQFPAICNSCGRRAEYVITTGAKSLLLCPNCSTVLKSAINMEQPKPEPVYQSDIGGDWTVRNKELL